MHLSSLSLDRLKQNLRVWPTHIFLQFPRWFQCEPWWEAIAFAVKWKELWIWHQISHSRNGFATYKLKETFNDCTYLSLFVCLLVNFYRNIIDTQYPSSLRCTSQWLDIFVRYRTAPTTSPVIICHHTKILQYYGLHFLCRMLCELFILQLEACTSSNPSLFHLSPLPLPSLVTHSLFPVSLCLFLFCLLFMFVCLFVLDSTYEWNCTVFSFPLTYSVSLNTLSIHPSCLEWQDFILFFLTE